MIYLIGFISTVIYCWNIVIDCMEERPINSHWGYGVVSVMCLYELEYYPLLIIMLMAFGAYSLATLVNYLDSKK